MNFEKLRQNMLNYGFELTTKEDGEYTTYTFKHEDGKALHAAIMSNDEWRILMHDEDGNCIWLPLKYLEGVVTKERGELIDVQVNWMDMKIVEIYEYETHEVTYKNVDTFSSRVAEMLNQLKGVSA